MGSDRRTGLTGGIASASPEPESTGVGLLAARARRTPADPWLFYREGWEWSWRSWRRVADQVARGAAEIRRRASNVARRRASNVAPPVIAYGARQDPDAVAAGLAIQAVGAVALPVAGGVPPDPEEWRYAAWAEVECCQSPATVPPGVERWVLPAARTQLDRTERRPLAPADPVGGVRIDPSEATLSARRLMDAARDLDARIALSEGRSIVCADPELGLAASRSIETWTLLADAAWVLEPDREAFFQTVLWARPTVVFAAADALERLGELLAPRKRRRHSRIRVAVRIGEGRVREALWRDLEVRIVGVGENPLQSIPGETASNPDPTNDIP